MEESDLPNLGSDQSLGLDNTGPKLADFANRPAGKRDNVCIYSFLPFQLILQLKQTSGAVLFLNALSLCTF